MASRQQIKAPITAITQLQQLCLTLGKQTSQYIAKWVRGLFRTTSAGPIAEAVKGREMPHGVYKLPTTPCTAPRSQV